MNLATICPAEFNAFGDNRREFYEDYASALRHNMGGPERLAKWSPEQANVEAFGPRCTALVAQDEANVVCHALQHTVPITK